MKLLSSLLILFFFCLSPVYGKTLAGFCFPPKVSLQKARFHLSSFVHPEDEVFTRPAKNCLEVKTNEKRASLYETLLRKKLPVDQVYSNTESNQGSFNLPNTAAENCRISIKEKTVGNSKRDDFSLGRKSGVSRREEKFESTNESQLLIDSGSSGHINVDNLRVKLTCVKASGRFLMKVQLEHGRGGVSTSLTVTPGQEVNIGEVVRNLKNKNNSLSLNKGIENSRTKGQSRSTYTMTVQ